MRDPEDMDREELLAEVDDRASASLASASRRCTTEQLREMVRGVREQIAFYAAGGKDAAAQG